MAGELVRCEGCKRHVFAGDAACPFCKAPLGRDALGLGLAATVALSAGLSLAGCTAAPAPVYGGPPAPVETATAAPTATTPPNISVPAYGMPPPPPPTAPSASASASPRPPVAAYGAPPPRKP